LKAEANRVTQELLALKPFVFPAPALPAPAPKKPKPDSDELDLSSLKNFRQTYPCEACRDAVTFDYCDTCRPNTRSASGKNPKSERKSSGPNTSCDENSRSPNASSGNARHAG